MNRNKETDPAAWRRKDPKAGEESRRYGEALPSREWILQTLRHANGPRSREQLVEMLGLTEADPLEGFSHRLSAMVRDGQLIRTRRGGYGVPEEMSLVSGRVLAHRDGFGFLVPEDGGDDLFLPPQQMQSLWPGDRVLARAGEEDRRGRREAVVVEVLERGVSQVVGRLLVEHGVSFVQPENPRILHELLVPPEARAGAREGQMVVAEVLSHPRPRKAPVGKVVEVLGEHLAPGMEIEAAIRAHGIPHVFPEAALAQAKALPEAVREEDIAGRKDLRKLPLVTIDGEDARDFDDAICARRTLTGWKLWVAIADVDAYVPFGSPLDLHARERGNSVYFPEHVVPMLPEKLSNGLCSLNPQVDRLCMICEMRIGRDGSLRDHRFYEGVMRSQARLTYSQVAAALDGDTTALPEPARGLMKPLRELEAVYQALAQARAGRGTVAFESGETRFVFDEGQKIERIVPVQRNRAHMIVEECMIAANIAAARHVLKHKRGALFRVHMPPAPEKIQALREFLNTIGLSLGGGAEPEPADLQAVMQQAQERPDRMIIQNMMLRAMMQARYAPDCDGHFGLALDEYAHFTSPIRRYPDLVLHRAIKRALRKRPLREEPLDHAALEALGATCSATERRADEATRDVALWLKCEYMQQHVGEVFAGTVNGVAPFGLFVTLNDVYVEGLVHVTALDNDYYEHDPAHGRLIGRRSGRSYRIGDPVTVRVARVSLDDRKIDLEIAPSAGDGGDGKPGRSPRSAPAQAKAAKKRNNAPGKRGGRGAGGNRDGEDRKTDGGGKSGTKRAARKRSGQGKAGGAEGSGEAPKAASKSGGRGRRRRR